MDHAVDPWAALRVPNYRRFAVGFLTGSTGLQLLNATVAWELYERTGDALVLGMVGLCRSLPVVLLALPAGHLADIRDRRIIVVCTQAAFAVVAMGFALLSYWQAPVWAYYLMLVASACVRAINGPARGSLLPLLVSDSIFANVVTYQSGIFQAAAIGGPLLAGFLIQTLSGQGQTWAVYAIASACCALFALAVLGTQPRKAPPAKGTFTMTSMLAGLQHMWRERPIFAAILLDLLAVLFGGATALLPVYARDILHVDAIGYGALRAAPYVGALVVAAWLAFRPQFKRAGPVLLWSVGVYALCIIAFGYSTNMWLSLAALAASGGADNVSVVIRHVLVQMRTPNHLRGRVGAVNSMFIECSNELGSFESGAVASLFTPVISVVSGGVGTLVVIAGIALTFPQLRRLGRIRPLREPELEP